MRISGEVETRETSTSHGPRLILVLDSYREDENEAMLDRREVEVLREACDAFLSS